MKSRTIHSRKPLCAIRKNGITLEAIKELETIKHKPDSRDINEGIQRSAFGILTHAIVQALILKI